MSTKVYCHELATAIQKLDENVYVKLSYDAAQRLGDTKELKKAKKLVLSKEHVDYYVKVVNNFIDSGVSLYDKSYWGLSVRDSICAVAGAYYTRLQSLPKYYKDLKIYANCIESRESATEYLNY